jgi:hypothetical protein
VKITLTMKVIVAFGFSAIALMGLSVNQEIPSADPVKAAIPVGLQHNHDDLTWPPQPRGIANIVIYSDVEQERKDHGNKKDRMDSLERIARADPRSSRALGNKFTRITVIDKEDKKSGKVVSRLAFFNRDKNTTVEVDFHDKKIQAVNTKPAGEYQPEITDDEVSEAAELARTYFLNQGLLKVAGLKAYGILAYRPEGNGFFDTRVIYVSFHKHDDAPPELAAWVDLSKQLIIKTREEQ